MDTKLFFAKENSMLSLTQEYVKIRFNNGIVSKLFLIIQTTTTTTTSTTRTPSENHTLFNWSALLPPRPFRPPATVSPPVCGHIFTTYILPDILHFVAFIIGFIYFRVTEGEPIYSLMEKVLDFLYDLYDIVQNCFRFSFMQIKTFEDSVRDELFVD